MLGARPGQPDLAGDDRSGQDFDSRLDPLDPLDQPFAQMVTQIIDLPIADSPVRQDLLQSCESFFQRVHDDLIQTVGSANGV